MEGGGGSAGACRPGGHAAVRPNPASQPPLAAKLGVQQKQRVYPPPSPQQGKQARPRHGFAPAGTGRQTLFSGVASPER